MKEMRYMISDAAKKISVEPHVLRYWEEELEVEIPRNEMGHRYYREEDIQMMQEVKYLKERGFQLKSIKILLPDAQKVMQLPHRRLLELRDRLELAVSREELRLQRERELQNCSAEKDLQAGAEQGEIAPVPNGATGKDEKKTKEAAQSWTIDNQLEGGTRGTEQKEEDNRTYGCEAGSKKEMNHEIGKAAGERMKNKVGRQKERTITAQAMPQEEEKEMVPGGQAARLIEMWQSKNTESKPRKKTAAQQNCPDEAADIVYTSEVVPEDENAGVQGDFEAHAQTQGACMQQYSRTEDPANISEEKQQFNPLASEAAVRISDNAARMQQFKGIMNEIITDAMRENNRELAGSITSSVSKEMEYHMRKREIMLEEHFKQLDRTLREYQLGQKQAAVARECGGRRESRFFRKNKKVRI